MLTVWVASTVDRVVARTIIRPSLAEASDNAIVDTPHARLFLHRERARAAIILVHGYLGGHYAIEERAWPVRRWFARGYDIALFTLPFHGVREGSPKQCLTPEGLARATSELRALVKQLRDRGTSRIAAMGMSLGGYLVAMLATTTDAKLDVVVPVIPLSNLRDFAGVEVEGPLHRTPRITGDRVLVIGAEQDRIAPIAHARALADHFQAPLTTMRGGHILQLGRAAAFAEIDHLLERRLG